MNYEFSEQFVKKCSFIVKYIIICVRIGQIGSIILLSYLLILAYMNDPDNSSIVMSIFWWSWSVVLARTLGALLVFCFFYIYMVSYYLKLRFRQNYADFNYSDIFSGIAWEILTNYFPKSYKLIKNFLFIQTIDSNTRLFDRLSEHNDCCRLINAINEWMKYLLFAYYYLIVPAIDLFILIIIREHSMILKLSIAGLAGLAISNLFILNYVLSSISSKAHSSYRLLNSLFVRKHLSLRLKLKILSLIEKLSGPVIGIYCYDLFPFTNYELYIFTVNCISNFILFYGLFEWIWKCNLKKHPG